MDPSLAASRMRSYWKNMSTSRRAQASLVPLLGSVELWGPSLTEWPPPQRFPSSLRRPRSLWIHPTTLSTCSQRQITEQSFALREAVCCLCLLNLTQISILTLGSALGSRE